MQAHSQPSHGKDAWTALGVLLALGVLWLFLKLYWQGALLVVAAVALGSIVWRTERQASEESNPKPVSHKEPVVSSEAVGQKKSRKKRR